MPDFRLDSAFTPTADQPKAIAALAEGVERGERFQTLLGATGTGKTMTMAGMIEAVQRPTLVIAHNKTLAAQLCNEFRTFFPDNAVEYFVSYYDYYQPEAYVPSRDLYIEKDSAINQEVDRLRHAATAAVFARRDVIVVASVSCIYGLGSPETYEMNMQILRRGETIDREKLLRKLVSIQYTRNDTVLSRGGFRVKGETLEVFPAYAETAYRATLFGDEVERLQHFDPLTGELIEDDIEHVAIWPATHYNVKEGTIEAGVEAIGAGAERALRGARGRRQAARVPSAAPADAVRHGDAARDGLLLGDRELLADPRRPQAGRAAVLPDRLLPRRTSSASSTSPTRRCRRSAGCSRATARASRRSSTTASGCRARWTTGRRRFEEFLSITPQLMFVSATPGEYERTRSTNVVEQIVRPTGIVDPGVEVRETKNQIDDLMNEVRKRVERNERVLVTTLTKKMSEDLSQYLLEMGFKTRYLHSEIDTLERIQIIRDLRLGEYDVLVGVNLLREGLDLPEVSLVAILDADKEGFLRGETSLIQTIGRAARNIEGTVLMYADKETKAMKAAIEETDRRREIQLAYNEEHGITAATIVKGISDIAEFLQADSKVPKKGRSRRGAERAQGGQGAAGERARADGRRARGGDGSRPPRTCASSTPPSCATSCASCGATCGRSRQARRPPRSRLEPTGDACLGSPPWSSTGRASRSATFRSAGGGMTPRPWTRTCGRSPPRSRSCATRSKAARGRRSGRAPARRCRGSSRPPRRPPPRSSSAPPRTRARRAREADARRRAHARRRGRSGRRRTSPRSPRPPPC